MKNFQLITKHLDGIVPLIFSDLHNTSRKPARTGRRLVILVTASCLVLSLTACGNTKGDRALSGAGIGAGVGAVGSAVAGGSLLTGAVVGGAVGAAAGALTNKDQINLDK